MAVPAASDRFPPLISPHLSLCTSNVSRHPGELDPSVPVGISGYVAITQFLADLFPVRVDVANRGGLKALVRPRVERDAIYAF